MKAIILAAGMGTRLGKYTKNLPKGMLPFNGKSLIEWQLGILRSAGIDDIIILTGYKHKTIAYPDVKYYHNDLFASTNMIETLLCARNELDDDLLVAYSDIIYTEALVDRMLRCSSEIGVAVDPEWREYWKMRYGTTEEDLESLTVENGKITELGSPLTSSKGIDYRYIGLIKFSKNSLFKLLSLYDEKKDKQNKWNKSGKDFSNGYMTDLLNELIETGVILTPVLGARSWLEFDTVLDYERMTKLLDTGSLSKIYG